MGKEYFERVRSIYRIRKQRRVLAKFTSKLIEKYTLSRAVRNLVESKFGIGPIKREVIEKEIGISIEQYNRIILPSEYRSEDVHLTSIIKIAQFFNTTIEEIMKEASRN